MFLKALSKWLQNNKTSRLLTPEEMEEIVMACTVSQFEQVKLSYLNNAAKIEDPEHQFHVEVNRVSLEAQLTIFKKRGSEVFLKCTLTSSSECCKAGTVLFLIHIQGEDSLLLKFSSANELKRFQSVIDFNESKSVFDQRTEESSAVQYFQFYGYLSQQQNMMQDYIRTGTYQKAMLQNHVNFHDKVVLDVGAGSGILSFFAMQAGARKVYAVEASTMADHTRKLVRSSQYAGRIIVIPGKIEEITLPEKVDIIVSEPMGYMLFNERMLETFLHSKKFLKQRNGLMFPTIGDLHVAPFSDELLYMEQFTKANFWYQQSFHGVDLSPLRDDAVEEYFKQPIVDTFDVRILVAKSTKHRINFMGSQEEDLHRIEIPLRFVAHSSATVHGLAFWFDVAFIGSAATIWLSTAPSEALTHWYQVRCLLRSPLFVKAGEVILGKVVLRSNKRQSYDVDIEAIVEATGCKSENTLDLKNPFFHYNGQPTTVPAGAHTSSPSDPYNASMSTSVENNPQAVHNAQQQPNSNYQASVTASQSAQQLHQYNVSPQAQPHFQNHEQGNGNYHNVNGLNAYCNTVPLISGGIPYPGPMPNAKTSAAIPENYATSSAQSQNGRNDFY